MTKQQRENLVLAIVRTDPNCLISRVYRTEFDMNITADDIIGVNLDLRTDKPDVKIANFKFNHKSPNVQKLLSCACIHRDKNSSPESLDKALNWRWIPIIFTNSPTCLRSFRKKTVFDSYVSCLCKHVLNVDVNSAEEAELQLVLMGRLLK